MTPEGSQAGEDHTASLAWQLEFAQTDAQRAAIWREYIENHPDELAEAHAKASELLRAGNLEGLIDFLNRGAEERAAAHVARLQSEDNRDYLPPAA